MKALIRYTGLNLTGLVTYLFMSNGPLRSFSEFFDGMRVIAKIFLTGNKEDRKTLAEVENLGDPLYVHINVSMVYIKRLIYIFVRQQLPSLERCPKNLANQRQSKSK